MPAPSPITPMRKRRLRPACAAPRVMGERQAQRARLVVTADELHLRAGL